MKFLYCSKIQNSKVALPTSSVQDPLREPSRWRWSSLMIVIFALMLFLALTSCTRHHYSVIENKSVSKDSSAVKTTDTLKIYVRDSIVQKQVRDTIHIEKFRLVYRDRTIRDTIFQYHRDTILVSPQDIGNHTKIIAESSSQNHLPKIAIGFILIVLIILILKIHYKKF